MNAVEIQGQLSISLDMLINQLDDRGCHLMHLEDPEHRAWQRELKKGDALNCKGTIYVLDDELLSKKMIKNEKTRSEKIPINRYRVFKLATHPHLVIKIGKTPFDLSLDSYKFKKYHFGIPSVEGVQNVLETDDGHPFVLLEFLPQSLAEHRWTSSSFQLNPKDEEICSRIASFLFCMRDWHLWPNQIYPEDLYMDSAKIIRITACLDWGPSPEIPVENYCGPENYLAAEKFCLKVAKINQRQAHSPILHYLMKVSEYNMHCMAQFYRKSVMTMLKTGEFDFLNLSFPIGYDHSVYKKRLTKLFSQAKAMRANCLYRVTEYRESIPKNLKEAFLKKTIRSIRHWHHFEEQKSSYIEEIAKIDRELANIQKEKERKRERSSEFVIRDKFRENTNTIKTVINEESSLNKRKKKLKLDKNNQYEKIFELTVFDRLINAYLESGTPGIISETLIEIVLESFKNPIEIEEDRVTYNKSIPSVFDGFKNLLGNLLGNFKNPIEERQSTANSYYQVQKELIIAKNQYGIKLIKNEIGELSSNPKALFHL